jgi:glycosyltransferase involved in cell wall biosynthesis
VIHVGLNLIYLVPGQTGGMETYARELIAALAAVEDLRLTAFVSREGAHAEDAPWGRAVSTVVVPVDARNRREWVRGEQQLLPRLARRAGVDLVHSLASTAPVWGRFRRVVTIHDLIYLHHPGAHFGLLSRGMRVLVPLGARRSTRVITGSQAIAEDLVANLGIPSSQIDVVPHGIGLRPPSGAATTTDVRAQLGFGERPMVLTVSAKRPHKNLARLIGALALIAPERRPVLALPGYPTPHEEELRRLAARLLNPGDVHFLDWVRPETLEGLYAAASAFVFPSLYEGFGLPVLEAMARGIPVACSAAPTLDEVAADACLRFDPLDTAAIARAIETLIRDRDRARDLAHAGLARAALFTWERTAALTLESYRRALAARA